MKKLVKYLGRICLFGGFMVTAMSPSFSANAQVTVGIYVNVAPPPLPVYEQPQIPGRGYIWTPGYWAWDGYVQDYYWVPGTWVRAPRAGYLWTPGYWSYDHDRYGWREGYWGLTVGYYGGVFYGYGYTGFGYEGGEWRGRDFYYNRYVNNIGSNNWPTVYNKTINNNITINNYSYNGPGGVNVTPTAQQLAPVRERMAATPVQSSHEQAARSNPELRATRNNGKPPIAATSKPAELNGAGIVPAKAAAPYTPPNKQSETKAVSKEAAQQHETKHSAPGENAPAAQQHQTKHSAPGENAPAAQQHQTKHSAPGENAPAAKQHETKHSAPGENAPAAQQHQTKQSAPRENGPAAQQHQSQHSAPRENAPAEQQRKPQHKATQAPQNEGSNRTSRPSHQGKPIKPQN